MDDEAEDRQSTETEAGKAELVRRGPDGRWLPGTGSGNPGGLSKEERDAAKTLASAIRDHKDAGKLLERLYEIALKGSMGNPTTVRAIELLYERGFGKAPVTIEGVDGKPVRVAVIILPGEGQGGDQ